MSKMWYFRSILPIWACLVVLRPGISCLDSGQQHQRDGVSNELTSWRYGSSSVDPDMTLELSEMVSRLQAQVAQLQEQRAEDRAVLQLLRDSCNKGLDNVQSPVSGKTPDLIRSFQTQLGALKSDLSSLVAAKERQTERSADVREMRLELDSVHSEWQKMRLEVQALKDRRGDDLKRNGQQRNSEVTIKWLQKSMEELKREMKELAQAQNVSAAIGQRSQFETGLGLLRSDVVALRTQWEEVKVKQDMDGATLDQLQRDVNAMQQHQQESAASGQLFREQLSQFKDELLAATMLPDDKGATVVSEALGRFKEGAAGQETPAATGAVPKNAKGKPTKLHWRRTTESREELDNLKEFTETTVATKHRLRHGGRVRDQVAELRKTVESLSKKQSKFDHQLGSLRWNHSVVDGTIRHLWGRLADLLNATRSKTTQQKALERTVDDLKSGIKRMDETVKDRDKVVHQLADSVTGIDKLHSSTVQLFEALEALEDEYGKRIDDLHKEVSKFEFAMAKVTSTVDILKEDQTNHYDALKLIRSDANGLRQDIEKNSYKLASLRSEVLHDEAQRLLETIDGGGSAKSDNAFGADVPAQQQSNILDLEARLAQLNAQFVEQNLEVNQLKGKLNHKADMEHVTHWAISADQLEEKISNLSRRVEPLDLKVGVLEQNLQKVYHQFPTGLQLKSLVICHVQQRICDCWRDGNVTDYNFTSTSADMQRPSDCSRITGPTGVYQIFPPDTGSPVTSLCDMGTSRGGWTMVQQRRGSGEDFNRNWETYKKGFGKVEPDGDFWIGNDILHRLTADRNVTLRFDLWDTDGQYYYAQYRSARIGNEESFYKLEIEENGFEGNASDALNYHRNMKFSTYDVDNDVSSLQCARQYEGGWWYNHCQHVNINGKFSIGLTWYDVTNNVWIQLASIQMKIRPYQQ